MLGRSDLSSLAMTLALDHVRDVDRDREADVVVAAVVAELRVHLVGVVKKFWVTFVPYFASNDSMTSSAR